MFLEIKENISLIWVFLSYGFALGVFVFVDGALGGGGVEPGVMCARQTLYQLSFSFSARPGCFEVT